MRNILFAFLLTLPVAAFNQELNCEVKVICPKCQMADPGLFADLETAIREFMNNRKWTSDTYQPHERISCQIIITISEERSIDRFGAEASIVSSRPVYNSDYQTALLNHRDKQWEFGYSVSQPLEFSEVGNLSNLTSLLAYYAYIIIGLDYDTYGRYGGTPWYLKAQAIVNNSQNAPEVGWKSYDGLRNRYWLVENLLSPKFTDYRSVLYTYHLKALDQFYTNPATSTKTFVSMLNDLDKLNKAQPNSMLLQLFFNAKKQELMDIFAGAPPAEKVNAKNVLCRLDPTNCNEYSKAIG